MGGVILHKKTSQSVFLIEHGAACKRVTLLLKAYAIHAIKFFKRFAGRAALSRVSFELADLVNLGLFSLSMYLTNILI